MVTIKKTFSDKDCIDCSNVLETLKEDNKDLKFTVDSFKQAVDNIEEHTRDMATTLREFRIDQKEYVGLIAGKKQVPLSIFGLIVFLLVTLLIASEVRYTKTDISLQPIGNSGPSISVKPQTAPTQP